MYVLYVQSFTCITRKDAIIVQDGREALVLKALSERRAVQAAKVARASQDRLDSRDLAVSLACVVILDSQAVQEHQVGSDCKALKVIRVS